MKQGMLLLLSLVCLPSFADESKVYLLATFTLGGSNLASGVFLYEPEITDLQTCGEAVKKGQRDRDWMQYHHILRRDKMKGYTGQVHYRCVTSDLNISTWDDDRRYDHAYLISIGAQSDMRIRETPTLADCSSQFNALPVAKRALSQCARSSQRIQPPTSLSARNKNGA
jgi:hypothetical protein